MKEKYTKKTDSGEDSVTSFYLDVFLVAMIVDWVAMSFEFGDTAKEYYEKNKEDIKLPEWAIKDMYKIFECIYP